MEKTLNLVKKRSLAGAFLPVLSPDAISMY